ncbi:MAG: riboflavin biosynthesis protein RibF [Bacteroidota bacterium]
MNVFYDLSQIGTIPNPVVTTGSFDGVHIGHKMIIQRINKLAREINGESVLITFNPHPRKVLFPDTAGKDLFLINSQQEKIELLRKTGLKNLVIIPFTLAFSQISSIDFIRNILVGKLHASKIVIGFNHHFGHNREGNFDYLYELGKFYNFDVEEIPEQDIHNETVSSTLIRKALQEGKIQRANAYLDHHYIISGMFRKGSDVCENIAFPTVFINVEEECKLVPPDGVYAVHISVDNQWYKGILNIKNSFYDNRRCIQEIIIEVYIFECPEGLGGKTGTISFAKRIRDEIAFSSDEELKKQLENDRAEVEELIY